MSYGCSKSIFVYLNVDRVLILHNKLSSFSVLRRYDGRQKMRIELWWRNFSKNSHFEDWEEQLNGNRRIWEKQSVSTGSFYFQSFGDTCTVDTKVWKGTKLIRPDLVSSHSWAITATTLCGIRTQNQIQKKEMWGYYNTRRGCGQGYNKEQERWSTDRMMLRSVNRHSLEPEHL